MANATTCDRDGKTPAYRIEVSVAIADKIGPGSVIAHAEGLDSCDACEAGLLVQLLAHSMGMVDDQAPYLEEIRDLDAARAEAQEEKLAATTPAEEKKAIAKSDRLDRERLAKVREGTAVSDKRKAAFVESIRA